MSEAQPIGIGLLGYGFIGRAHAHAFRSLPIAEGSSQQRARLVAVCGHRAETLRPAATLHGFERQVTDWRRLVDDPDIQLFDNCGPNHIHAEPTISAAEAGKHVICEKPLAGDATVAFEMWRRVQEAGVVHMCAFNYRFVPAIRLAREMIEAGTIGEVRQFTASYLQDWGLAAPQSWRFEKGLAGSGVLGDLGSHVVDLARYLVGEINTVQGSTRTYRPGSEVDDTVAAVAGFENGALGIFEASRLAPSRKNSLRLEIYGSQGSLAFDLERLNELKVSEGLRGFRTVLVTEPEHPFMGPRWPPGHMLGWEHTLFHELEHMLDAINGGRAIGPHGATFEDGYRAAEVCDAILRSAHTRASEEVPYRTLAESVTVSERPSGLLESCKVGEPR